MKINLIFLYSFIFTFSLLKAQSLRFKVGKNLTNIENSAALEIQSNDKGFLLPRLTETQMNAITSPVNGLVVYCTDCNPIGIYCYNEFNWKGVSTNVSAGSGLTFESGNLKLGGSLLDRTTIALGSNSLSFTSSPTAGSSHFTVDGNTLNIDALNNRVGLGCSIPVSVLDIVGGTNTQTTGISIANTLSNNTDKISSIKMPQYMSNNYWEMIAGISTNNNNDLYIGGNFSGSMAPASNIYFKVDGDNLMTNNQTGANSKTALSIVRESANIGIGTSNPLAKLDVRGNVNLNIMPGYQQVGELRLGRLDNPLIRFHKIITRNSVNASGNYIEFHLHNGLNSALSANDSLTNVLNLYGNGDVLIKKLVGVGNRMVIANEDGILTTQTLPATIKGLVNCNVETGSLTQFIANENITNTCTIHITYEGENGGFVHIKSRSTTGTKGFTIQYNTLPLPSDKINYIIIQ